MRLPRRISRIAEQRETFINGLSFSLTHAHMYTYTHAGESRLIHAFEIKILAVATDGNKQTK